MNHARPGTLLELTVLGPIRATVGGRPLELGYAKQRGVLALLAVEAGQVVPIDRLIQRVWGDEPPPSARNVLYGHVARLRRALTGGQSSRRGGALQSRSGGYLLDVRRDAVDLHRFRALVAGARGLTDPADAVPRLEAALALWHGPALAGLEGRWSESVRTALEHERLCALLALCDLRLALGDHPTVLADLSAAEADHPLHEGIVYRLMLVLHADGRTADALERYSRMRQRLVDGLGTDPGRSLTGLHQRILRRDPTLEAPGTRAFAAV